MLTLLYVKNYALIKELRFEPLPGMNVITGETGAGKSIMLGALGLVLGNRADNSVMMLKEEKCLIEAVFKTSNANVTDWIRNRDLDLSDEIIMRREISPAGKSRAFINDTPVNLSDLKELGDQLIEIHTQNTGLMIREKQAQLELLDAFAENQNLKTKHFQNYTSWIQSKTRLDELDAAIQQLQMDKDFIQFQYDELAALKLTPGEEEELESKSNLLAHASEIAENIYKSTNLIVDAEDSAYSVIASAKNHLKNIAAFDPDITEAVQKLELLMEEMKDLSKTLQRKHSGIDGNPELLEQMNARLAEIQLLKRKHRAESSDELLTFQNALLNRLTLSSDSSNKREELLAETESLEKSCRQSAAELHENRKTAAKSFAANTIKMLRLLGMPQCQLDVDCTFTNTISAAGSDEITILFSAHGKAELPLEKIASGGEASRLNFCFKSLIAGKKNLPAVVFDEADTGISGEVAVKMGEIMRQMSQNLQVIAITHLPQVAARGHAQFVVKKKQIEGEAATTIVPLSSEDRVEFIAEMLGGVNPGEAAIANAKELIKANNA